MTTPSDNQQQPSANEVDVFASDYMDASSRVAASGGWATRRMLVLGGFALLASTLVVRAMYLQVVRHDFYVDQGAVRHERTASIPAHRGDLLDREGRPLAISTPIPTVWGVPDDLMQAPERLVDVADVLQMDADVLKKKVARAAQLGREFVYIKRHIHPRQAEEVALLDVDGLQLQREYRRYYPSGRAAAHVVGFTDIDDRGSEGLELVYDDWLSGKAGKRHYVRDLGGREITARNVMEAASPGRDLRLSVDKQLQYFADRSLIKVIEEHKAEAATVVVMAVATGEVLAMANYPSYNPNQIADRAGGKQRNRAVTDVFEPGSTMKPFTIAAALSSGEFTPDDIISTSPGTYAIGRYVIRDFKDYGRLDLKGVVRHSSNVGVSKIARQLEPDQMWSVFDGFGFGRSPGSEFPGEVAGFFNHPSQWHRIEQASVSYGYGISVSALQLARAYAALANGGVMPPVTFIADNDAAANDALAGQRVINESIALEVIGMLESVVNEGTGHRAQVPGYRIAGKTGTSRRSEAGGYAEDSHLSLFAGFAPASRPEIVTVVVVHDPQAGDYFGSLVAAPVFAEVMSHALRLRGVEPDDYKDVRTSQPPRIPVRIPSGTPSGIRSGISPDEPLSDAKKLPSTNTDEERT